MKAEKMGENPGMPAAPPLPPQAAPRVRRRLLSHAQTWARRFRLPTGASCCSLAALLLAIAHPCAAACLIRGTVLDADSAKPLPKTRVFARPRPDTAKPSILHFADQQGTFCFEHLEPGEYQVVADRPGYLSALYGARPGGEQGMLLTVDGQTELPLITLKLIRSAAIAGTVLDANGEPLEGAHVELDRKAWDKGWNPQWVGFRDTDDRGSFRFPLLAPGTYYINVKPEGGDGRPVLDEKGQPIRTAEALTYYNGSLTFARATPIPLAAGQEIANLLVTVDRVAPRHASGRLSSAVHLEPPGKVYFESDTGLTETPLRQDGTFSVDGLAPAKYRLSARTKPPVATVVDLTNGDVDGIVLEPEQTFDVRISARVEGPAPPGPLQLHAVNLDKGFVRNARQETGGAWMFHSIPPGLYRLETPQASQVFVKALVINGQPKPDAVLDLRKGQPGTLEAILSPHVANIEGRVERPEGALPSLATTVVVMDEAKSRTEVAGDAVTVDHTGKFKLESLAPAKYRVFAIEGFEEGLWGSPELAAALREKSLALELQESETKSLVVPLITPEEWTAALRKVGM